MEHYELAKYIVKAVNDRSRYYGARISRTPRLFVKLSGSRLCIPLRHGIIIERVVDECYIKKHAFVFLPDIVDYIRHLSRTNKEFASRVANMNLSADDLELMMLELSYGSIRLRMKGRKVFDIERSDNGRGCKLYNC